MAVPLEPTFRATTSFSAVCLFTFSEGLIKSARAGRLICALVGLVEETVVKGKPRLRAGVRSRIVALLAALVTALASRAEGDDPGVKVRNPELSVPHGFFSEPFEVQLTTATPDAELRYTLDGAEPGLRRGELYQAPLRIEWTTVLRVAAFAGGARSERVTTATYLFLDDVVRQPGMDDAVVDAPEYRDEIGEALRKIPTLCISLDPDVVNQDDALLVSEEEYLASFEFIYAADGEEGTRGFQIDCGVELHSDADPKTSLRLSFRQEYGADKLRYPFFAAAPLNAESAARTFDRLVLRGGKNKSWPNGSFRREVTYVEDQWVRDTQLAMSRIGARGTFSHLYVNGRYWGLYNPVERPDAWFAAAYLGGSDEDYFATNMNSRRGDHVRGDPTRFDEFHALAIGLADPERYAQMRGYLDVERYIDYVILFWFTGLGDGVNNNWYGGMRMDPPGPFRFYSWDSEFVFVPPQATPPGNEGAWVPPYFFDGSLDRHTIVKLWTALVENKDFQLLFADRVYQHCFDDGALTDANNRERLETLTDFIASAIIGESARWGEGRTRDEDWRRAVRILDGKMDGNVEAFIEALRGWRHEDWPDVVLYPEIDPPIFEQHGGAVSPTFLMQLHAPAAGHGAEGTLYYTLDGSDPRLPGGEVAPSATVHVGRFALGSTPSGRVTVKARCRLGDVWSPLNAATFRLQESPFWGAVLLSEIHYHPEDDGAEFLELYNASIAPVDLSGGGFTQGIEYTFPAGSMLAPGAYLTLASDSAAFGARYPHTRLDGVYDRRLSNGGERVTLLDAAGHVIVSVAYDDRFLWPLIADGFGRSLVLVDADRDPDEPTAWRASRAVGGSPGSSEESSTESPTETSTGRRVPGDTNQDGLLTIVDGIQLLGKLFRGDANALPCAGNLVEGGNLLLLDFDDSGTIELTDAVGVFLHLFDGRRPHSLGVGCVPLKGCTEVCP